MTQALCKCHGMPAWAEDDVYPVIWVCLMDDIVCDVEFVEADDDQL